MADTFYLSEQFDNPNFGGIKARNDIDEIFKKQSFTPISIEFCHLNTKSLPDLLKIYLRGLTNWQRVKERTRDGSVIFVQYPFGNASLNTKKMAEIKSDSHCKFVAIIHDLQSFQDEQISRKQELMLLDQFDVIVCHNKCMQEALIQAGIASSKLIVLDLFDYLTNETPLNTRTHRDGIVVAGNLAPFKASYVYKLASSKLVPLILYGPNYEEKHDSKADYRGSIPAEKLIGSIKGSFGLVWDGDSLSECNGTFGEYQKINNPHRVSMYLTAQIPVIIWNKAALRDFIVENNLGFGIDSLYQIPALLSSLDEEKYQSLVNSTRAVSEKLRDGYHTSRAIREALDLLSVNHCSTPSLFP